MPRPPTPDPSPRPPALPTVDAPLPPSKSQRKRDAHALQALGVQLVALSAAQLAQLALPEALHEAVAAAQRDGRLAQVRLAVSCIGPVPMRLQELESRLEGATLTEGQEILRQAQRHYEEILQPVDDVHGSVAYKTYLTGVLLGRALTQAVGANGRQ